MGVRERPPRTPQLGPGIGRLSRRDVGERGAAAACRARRRRRGPACAVAAAACADTTCPPARPRTRAACSRLPSHLPVMLPALLSSLRRRQAIRDCSDHSSMKPGRGGLGEQAAGLRERGEARVVDGVRRGARDDARVALVELQADRAGDLLVDAAPCRRRGPRAAAPTTGPRRRDRPTGGRARA